METTKNLDIDFTSFIKSLSGYGEFKEDSYSYSDPIIVEEIFDIIESIIFFSLVSKRMSENQGLEPSIDLLKRLEEDANFIKATKGLSFVNGGFEIENISKEEVIKGYVAHRKACRC